MRIKNTHRDAPDDRTNNEGEHHENNTAPEDYKLIAAYVQDKLYEIQNPQSCESAKKVVCDLPRTGFGSQVHLLTVCFTVGFMTHRTVICRKGQSVYEQNGWGDLFLPLSKNCSQLSNQTVLKVTTLSKTENIPVIQVAFGPTYIKLERSIPENIRKRVLRFHPDPQLWWAGQMISYILRPTIRLNNLITESRVSLGFKKVIVGLHIRRTDKLKEAYYYNVTEYMKAADNWFNIYEQSTGRAVKTRKIFLVTDEPSVVSEANQLFSNYTVINNMNATVAASKYTLRLKYSSLKDTINDIFLLSMCDYIVCTMSSNICRLAFELMQTRHKDGSKYAKSLDCEYFIHKLYKRQCDLKPERDRQFNNTYTNLKLWS
ncbi:alpha-(1,6)-fucosyltransferase-like [Ruditapes philippinarum]|uniref:alpha-(1,6)-fucosyltransferase-like n=1 Tax=Ruditapes philippinarum TaxID=129788 RepID=UPI00295B0E75|nr:alpha-(1,6)-fucosyltransferase-like [Ruditapes philippinarum]